MRPFPLQTIDQTIDRTIADVIEFAPRIVGAIVILLVGWALGRLLYGVVWRVVDRVELDRLVMRTPLGRVLGDTERGISRTFGRVSAWFVYALAVLAAANVLDIDLLSEWLAAAVSYLPSLIAGALVIVVGFILADVLADVVARTETVTDTGYTGVFADGVRIFLYFIAIVIGLDTAGVDVEILYTFSRAAAWGLAAGIALAIGIAFGWGSTEYVAENIGDWLGRTRRGMKSESNGGESSTGESNTGESSAAGDES